MGESKSVETEPRLSEADLHAVADKVAEERWGNESAVDSSAVGMGNHAR